MAESVDARIPLGFQFPQLPTAMSAAQLQQLQYRNQLAQIDLQQAQQQNAQRNAMLSIFKEPGAMGENGLPTEQTVGRVMQVNPDAGFKLANGVAQYQEMRQRAVTNSINQRLLGLKINDDQHSKLVDIATSSQVRYDELVKNGTSPTEAALIAGRERNQALADARKSGIILPDQEQSLQTPFDPEINRAFIAGSPQYKTVLAERHQAQMEQVAQDRQATADRRANDAEDRAARALENAGETPFMKEAAQLYGKDTPEYKQALKDHLAKQSSSPGGTGGQMGSREAVYVNRALSSANMAVGDLANVARGPITQSTGIFGGRSQGPSLLDATREQLANKITSQEAQVYNVKVAGIQRNLATLESQGLAPSGSLTHQMDTVVFKETDTNLTKAYKLAETRQIVDRAMDVIVNNDRAPQTAKDMAAKIQAQTAKAVPFTIEDLDSLQTSKNPKASLRDFVSKQQQGAKKQAPQAALDYLKAHPEAKDQFKAKYGYLP